ncbi:MAG: alpha/beta fold hydrolase [Promethearchaeota archaeon]|nr:MAG: alpha/beta fold hydrolase [Candidatus Lokiarchaeota archaeon]
MAVKKIFTSSKKRTILFIGLIILTSGLIGTIIFTYYPDPAHPYNVTNVTLVTEDDVNLQAIIFTPANLTGCAVINSHGFCGNKRWNQHISIELAKRGILVIAFDARGHGASDGVLGREDLPLDIMAAIQYLQGLGTINKIGLVGHSMGAGNSMNVAKLYPNLINATVAIGAARTTSDISDVENLLMLLGKYEQTQPPSLLFDFLEAYTGNPAAELGVVYGNFTLGNATKAVLSPNTEHLLEPFDPVIITETIIWFELAFFGAQQGPITITSTYILVFLGITMVGVLIALFIVMVYLGNYMFKGKIPDYSEKTFIKNQSVLKPVVYYLLFVPFLAFLLLLPLSTVFSSMVPIDMFGAIFSSLVLGQAVWIAVVYYLFLSRTESGHRSFSSLSSSLKTMISTNPGHSLLYGILAATITIAALATILDWSFNTGIPTLREIGTIFTIAILFFPFLLLKEFYLRTVQERLRASKHLDSHFKEYFYMVGLGLLMDLSIPIVLMLLTWQTSLGVIAFVIFPTSIFNFCRQLFLPWIYQNAGRNIMGSTIFYSILWAWMIVGFYPFGGGASISIF